MTRHVHLGHLQTPFRLLVRIMDENRVSAIPIVNQQGIPIGIVSESDLLLQVGRDDDRVASELMSSPTITVASHSSLSEAGRLMREKNVGRLVVVDERGRIVGILSRSDLVVMPGLLS